MSKSLISGKVLVIQLGRDQSRVALVNAGGEIQHSVMVPTPAGAVEDGVIENQEAVRKMLRGTVGAKEFRGTRKAVFCMSTSQVITETVTVPNLPEQKLEKLLVANADMYFPVDMSEYQLVWQTIGPKVRENGLTELAVQLWAVPLNLVTKYYSVANACGLSVEAVDFVGNSVATAVGASFSAPAKAKAKAKNRKKFSLNMEISFGKKKKKPYYYTPTAQELAEPAEPAVPNTDLYISLDTDLLGMTFVQGGQVVMQRFVQCGEDPVAQLYELSMMLEYYRSLDIGRGSEIKAWALGYLGDDREMLNELSMALGVDVFRFGYERDPKWIIPMAAAQTCKDFGVPALNKAAAARKQMSAELWQYILVLLCGAVLVFIVMLTLSSRLVWNAEVKGLENTQQNLNIQAAKTAGYADNYNTYSRLYDSYSADWDTIFGSLRTYNDNLVLVMQELEDTLPKKSSVVQLEIGPQGMNVVLAADTKEEAAYLIMALRKLRFADLVAISDLQGGGKGPATNYGPKGEIEDAPVEGGNSRTGDEKPNTIADFISKELSREELMALATTMSREEFELLEKAYGKTPDSTYETIEAMKNDQTVSATFTQRSDAVDTMFNSDPFAVNHFINCLDEDKKRDDPIIYWYVLEDILTLQLAGKLPAGGLESAEGVQAYAELLADILTKDEERMDAAEKFFATDPYLEKTYLHHLEVQMSLREAETVPYLNLEAVLEDLMSGSFDTTNPELDKKLNGLISQETWDMIDQMNSEEEMEALLTKYLVDGTTGNEVMDTLINQYLTTGTTGSEALDAIIDEKLNGQDLGQQLGQMMEEYLTNGTTGKPEVDAMLTKYLTTGTTGDPQKDAFIEKYLSDGKLDAHMEKMLEKYLTEGTTGNDAVDTMIKNYLANGTTGNGQLDEMITGYLTTDAAEKMIGDLVEKYLTDGTTDSEALDGLIVKFLNTGSTGNKDLDKMIENYLNGGNVDAELANLIQKYFNDGTTGIKALDSLIEKYLTEGSTGNKALDKIILNYINAGQLDAQLATLLKKYLSTGSTGNPVLDKMLKSYTTTGTTGNKQLDKIINKYLGDLGLNLNPDNGGGLFPGMGNLGGGMDTRIFFLVSLQYNEELISAELARKGLDYTQKVEKLEVEQ